QEPKYGLAVTGIVHPDKILTKGAARPGDVLVLTKPIGVGVVTTAIKRGLASEDEIREVTDVMRRLNNVPDVLHAAGVRCATEITGWGVLGHAAEVARESRVAWRIFAGKVPVLPRRTNTRSRTSPPAAAAPTAGTWKCAPHSATPS